MAETKTPDLRLPRTRIRCGALLAAVKDVTGVVAGRSTIPILDFVRFSCTDGAIALITTDLDMWVTRTLASDVMGQPDSAEWKAGTANFTIAVPAKPLEALLGQIDPDAMVTLVAPNGSETRAVIKAGRARFKLACLPVEEFPLPPPEGMAADGDPVEFEMPVGALGDLLGAVEHAVSTEATRYYLNGVFVHPFQLEGEPQSLRAAATDGHRLARLAMPVPEGAAAFPPTIIARGTVAVLDKLLARALKAGDDAAVVIAAEGRIGEYGQAPRLRFTLPTADDGTAELLAKTVDGAFPDYVRVIPGTVDATAQIVRAPLIEAIKRCAVLGDEKTRAVKLEFEQGKLTVSVTTPELGEGREELPCDLAGDAVTLGADSRYLLAALGAFAGDVVALGLSGPGGPIRLRAIDGDEAGGGESERLVQVVMPVRV
jgi:DNA polymerase-3 subunit beta